MFYLIEMVENIGTEADPRLNGRLVDVIDDDWINDEIQLEDIYVPLEELPDQEQESGKETKKEIERKWTDNNLQALLNRIDHQGG